MISYISCTKPIVKDGDGDMELDLLEEIQDECDFMEWLGWSSMR